MATREIAPLRVWLYALIILAVLAVLAATVLVVLNDPFKFLTARQGFGIACCGVITGSFMPRLRT